MNVRRCIDFFLFFETHSLHTNGGLAIRHFGNCRRNLTLQRGHVYFSTFHSNIKRVLQRCSSDAIR